MWLDGSLSVLHLLIVLWCLCADPFVIATKNADDPHYREMNKQVRNNAGLTLLLKEDLQIDDYAKLHGRVMDNYHELLTAAFRRVGIKSFDYSCSVREGYARYHSVQELSLFVGHEDCSDEKIVYSNSTDWQIQVTLGFNWVPSVKPAGSKLNMYICIDNVANRDALPQTRDVLYLITSYDVILLPSKDLVDSYTKYLYQSILLDVHVQAPIVALASIHPNKESFVTTTEFLLVDGYMASNFKNFTKAHIKTLRNCPTKPTPLQRRIPSIGDVKQAFEYSSTRKMAVIVEPRITSTLEYVLRNVICQLPGWGLQIHYSTGSFSNEHYLRILLSEFGDAITFEALPFPMKETWEYNKLLKSYQFWEYLSFSADKVLIFQSDSLLLQKNNDNDRNKILSIQDFMQYDFIGSPWHLAANAESNLWLRRMQRHGALKEGVGNGGLSLRDVHTMLKITSQFGCDIPTYPIVQEYVDNSSYISAHANKGVTRQRKSDNSNEDVFFVSHAEKMDRIQLPNRATAYRFAQEGMCDDLHQNMLDIKKSIIPFGIHGAWNYFPSKWMSLLFEFSLTFPP